MSKGKTTTKIALFGALFYVVALVLFTLGHITANELLGVISGVTAAVVTFVGLFAKDQNATHSKTMNRAENDGYNQSGTPRKKV